LAIAGILAALAAGQLNRQPRHFPSLTSRLRVAIKSNPMQSDPIDAARDTAAAILQARPGTVTGANRQRPKPRSGRNNGDIRAGLILAATLLGWAATRRLQQARRIKA
jgi:hypothetical protein